MDGRLVQKDVCEQQTNNWRKTEDVHEGGYSNLIPKNNPLKDITWILVHSLLYLQRLLKAKQCGFSEGFKEDSDLISSFNSGLRFDKMLFKSGLVCAWSNICISWLWHADADVNTQPPASSARCTLTEWRSCPGVVCRWFGRYTRPPGRCSLSCCGCFPLLL